MTSWKMELLPGKFLNAPLWLLLAIHFVSVSKSTALILLVGKVSTGLSLEGFFAALKMTIGGLVYHLQLTTCHLHTCSLAYGRFRLPQLLH